MKPPPASPIPSLKDQFVRYDLAQVAAEAEADFTAAASVPRLLNQREIAARFRRKKSVTKR